MKHRIATKKLNRTSAHQRALLRNMAQSLIEHGQVRTTVPKARQLRPYIERLVTLARRAGSGSITARRQIHKLLSDRSMIPADKQSEYEDLPLAKRAQVLRFRSGRRHRTGEPRGKLPFTGASVSRHLITTLADRYRDRPGGYTRIIKLPNRRVGDGSFLAVVQFVGAEVSPGPVTRPGKSTRRRRADARYALAVKLTKQRRAAATGGTEGSAAKGDSSLAPS